MAPATNTRRPRKDQPAAHARDRVARNTAQHGATRRNNFGPETDKTKPSRWRVGRGLLPRGAGRRRRRNRAQHGATRRNSFVAF